MNIKLKNIIMPVVLSGFITDVITIAVLITFPGIVLWVPQLMGMA